MAGDWSAGIGRLGRVVVVAWVVAAATSCVIPENSRAREARPGEPSLTISTFNLHYLSPRVPAMAWEPRREGVITAIRDNDADIVAFQEVETFEGRSFSRRNVQLEDIRVSFPEFDFTAVGDPATYPSTQPILFRRDRFESVDQGFFFFSPTPDEIYSRPWHARFPAFASWARLADRRTGVVLVVFNVHFDAASVRNRIKSARLVAQRIDSLVGPDEAPVVVGDFNAAWFQRPVQIVARSGVMPAETHGATFHFNRGRNLLPAIDHVLAGPPLTPIATRVDRRSFRGAFPSDHYLVTVDLAFDR